MSSLGMGQGQKYTAKYTAKYTGNKIQTVVLQRSVMAKPTERKAKTR
jgi:hypothetical protein